MSETVQMFMEATDVAVKAYAQGARTHKDQEPRRRQWLRIRDALRAVVEADLLVVPIGENEAFDAGYAEGLADGHGRPEGSCPNDAGDVPFGNYVPSGWEQEDPVRTFYEIPDRIAEMVRSAGVVEGETFASCLHNLALEHAAALVEIKRLKRLAESAEVPR